ncbi:MAG: hypothetical protein ACOC1U_11315, partial [Spirochaetota bacterium]
DIWPLVVMLVPYFFIFRKHGNEARTKRLASLYQAIAVFIVTTAAAAVVAFDLTDAHLTGAVVLVAIAAYALRRHLVPYQFSCPECGRAYNLFSEDLRIVYVMDDNLCDSCRSAAEPQSPEA